MLHGKTTPKVLTDDEVKRILAATARADADLRDHVVLLLALTTGLRLAELVALDVGDLRNGKGVRTVVPLRVTKGGRPGDMVLPERTRRKVAIFLTWKAKRCELLDDDSPLFVSRGGGRSRCPSGSRLSARSVERLFEVWQRRAEFDRRLNFHATRHTFATRMLRASGGNLRVVQAACRHADIATTTIYAHVTADDVSQAADRLGW